MARHQLVSVVVPTRNSELTIEQCLTSVRNQTYRPIEVIVVDCFSRDQTRRIAEDHDVRVMEIRTGRSEARNYGASNSHGSYVLFVDSDMELSVGVVDECVRKVGDGFEAVIIPELSVGDGFWAKCKALEKACYVGDSVMEAARFHRKTTFERIGGYDTGLEAGEDWDLNHRIHKAGYRIGRVNAFIKHYEGRLGLRETVLKKGHYGKTLKRYKRKHPELARQQLKLIRPAFVRKWRDLANDPLHASGMLVLKSCEFGAGLIAYSSH